MTDEELDQAAADGEEDHFQMISEAEAGGCLGVVIAFVIILPAMMIKIIALIR